MPKLGMGPVRRRQLVDAAIAVIHDEGFTRATVARIAKRAGVSTGIVHHYFTDKDALLTETMRSLLAELRRDAAERLQRANSPSARIAAIIDASFGDGQLDGPVFSAWLALYGNARHSQSLRKILDVYHHRLHSNLMHDLLKLMDRERAEPMAEGIAAMIDGLWLRYALTGLPRDPRHPKALTQAYFERVGLAVAD